MVEKLSEKEDTLLQAVAFWLREEMLSRLANQYAPAPNLLHDQGQSNYEISCSALEGVGLLICEGQNCWRVKKPRQDQPDLGISRKRSDLDHLLEGLAIHSGYVNDLYQHLEIVTPTGHPLQQVCVAMAECGYMNTISSNEFMWTDMGLGLSGMALGI